MLNEILVLGQVPGTNFQVTFNELLFVFDVLLLAVLLRKRVHIIQRLSYYRLYVHLYLSTRKGQQLRLPV